MSLPTSIAPEFQHPPLYARLVGYVAREYSNSNPEADTKDEDISAEWIPVADHITGYNYSYSNDTLDIAELADSLIAAYKDDVRFASTKSLVLCISPLTESGESPSDDNIYMPAGTSESFTQPITAAQLITSLTKWISSWRRWQHNSRIHSKLISSNPSITNCGPVTAFNLKPVESGYPSYPSTSRIPRRVPELWVNPPSPGQELADDEPWVNPNPDPRAILVVDDNVVNCMILAKLLYRLGLNFKIAQNGQEAFDEYKRDPGRYWCVFMDQSMPIVDGFTSSRWIREYERENGLKPCVMVRMHPGYMDENKEDMFDYFLMKPVRTSSIADIMSAEKEREVQKIPYVESIQ